MESLLIFVKNPELGKVKTRLAATIGDAAALQVYMQLVGYTENVTRSLSLSKIVCYSDHLEQGDIWDDSIYHKEIQTGSDLGQRMENAFEYAFEKGNQRVAIIGSDCFEISAEIIQSAFDHLDYCDVVVGPAVDGGYYLLAMTRLHESLFFNMPWSTDQVLRKTLQECSKLGLKITMLQELVDIDCETDLKKSGYFID